MLLLRLHITIQRSLSRILLVFFLVSATILAALGILSAKSTFAGVSPNTAQTPNCGPNWTVVSSPNPGAVENYLGGVDALSISDVWSVGSYETGTTSLQTLALHWNGSIWSVVPSPNVGPAVNELEGVAAVSSGNVWAVGDYYDAGNAVNQTLVEHWNGSAWSVVSSPNVGTSHNFLYEVAAVSSSDVWAVGRYNRDTDLYPRTLVEHWNGSAWSVVSSPNIGNRDNYLFSVSAISSNDVWAVGQYFNGTVNQTLIEHWNGSAWSVVSSPNTGNGPNTLRGVTAIASNDVWAVGQYFNGTANQTLVEHWNGSAWSVVSSPNVGTGDNSLEGVAAAGSSNVWAVGGYDNSGIAQTLIEHWNGSAWEVVPSPSAGTGNNFLNGVAAAGASDIWAVGDYYMGNPAQTLIERYNPCPATPTATSTATSTNTPAPTQTPGGPTATSIPTDTATIEPTATSTVCPIQFTDVPVGSTFYAFVRCLACRGIINGYPDGTFKPNNLVTRGQLSKTVSNSAGFSEPQTVQMFQDVPVGSTFFDYVGRLASRGYIGGYACGGPSEPCVAPSNLPYFRSGNNATRGQISKIVSNAAGFTEPHTEQTFQDVPPGSTFYDYIERLASRGVMGGYPCNTPPAGPCVSPANLPYFVPNNNATRGQTSKIVANTFFPGCQTPSVRRKT